MQNESVASVDEASMARMQRRVELINQFKNGANWFWWIAGLSVVNSVIFWLNGSWGFVIGLGITQLIDGFAWALIDQGFVPIRTLIIALAIVLDLLLVILFVGFGYFARQRLVWAFIIGMALYICDSFIALAAQSWLNLGFHTFALFGLYGGYNALKTLNALEK
jgi:hypothetical protein